MAVGWCRPRLNHIIRVPDAFLLFDRQIYTESNPFRTCIYQHCIYIHAINSNSNHRNTHHQQRGPAIHPNRTPDGKRWKCCCNLIKHDYPFAHISRVLACDRALCNNANKMKVTQPPSGSPWHKKIDAGRRLGLSRIAYYMCDKVSLNPVARWRPLRQAEIMCQ